MIDYQGTNILEKGLESLADIFRMKYAAHYAEQAQPALVQTYQQVAIPTLIIIVIAIIVLWKWK